MIDIITPGAKLDDVFFDVNYHILNSDAPEHGHSFIEIITIVAGTALHKINGRCMNAYPGNVTIIHPGMTHKFSKIKGCELYNIACSPNLFLEMGVHFSFLHNCEMLFYPENNVSQFSLSGLLFRDAQNILKKMHDIYWSSTVIPDRHVQLRFLFSMFLVLMSHAYQPEKFSVAMDSRITETAKYMETHYNEKLTLEGLAKYSKMSKIQFLRKFRKEFDSTPMQYLKNYRMRQACILLEESNLSIDQIAFATGFYDSNYFIKLYKKSFGVPPAKNRRQTAMSRSK